MSWILVVFLFLLAAGLGALLALAARRLLQYDRLVELFVDDLEELVAAVTAVTKRELLTDVPEAVALHRAMILVRDRFSQHVENARSARGVFRKHRDTTGRPPVVA